MVCVETVRAEYSYSSTTGVGNIFARSWEPSDPSRVKAIFQIAHGMAEHGERYERFARFLASKGYAVFSNDHIGHGKSAASPEDLGYFGEKDGWIGFVSDAKLLTDKAKEKHPGVPVVFFGHSMGSFIARSYAEKFGSELAGAIFCGTSGINPAVGAGIMLAGIIAKLSGSRSKSELFNKMSFGGYNKRYDKVRTEFDWLSRDESEVDKYIADPLCGYIFTAVGYRDMFTILKNVSGKSWYKNVPSALPMLIISGKMDPVGEFGKGVKQVHKDLKDSGHCDVVLKLYDDARHELLNELNKDEVYKDILQWSDFAIQG
jgi:alpha-beta hydrolase superfamily lysophospholipase